jgi:P-type E1-E2 ATPase
MIFAVVIVNTAMGLIQEGKAEQAAAAIMAMLSSNARVLRDGEQAIVPADELVPGDIVVLKSGDKVRGRRSILAHQHAVYGCGIEG